MYRMVWTDERMDDFAKHTDQRFDSVDKRFDVVDRRIDNLEQRMEAGFDRVDRRFEQIDQRFEEVNGSIKGLHETIHRTMLQLGGGLIVTVAIGFAGIALTQL
jgi:tetrahydromethanopterin S-methyltransferase subunit G